MLAIKFSNIELQNNINNYFNFTYHSWGYNYLTKKFDFLIEQPMELCTLDHFLDIT